MSMNITATKGIMADHSAIVNDYLKDIAKYPVLTPDEEADLFFSMKNGDNSAREKIINSNQRFVFAIAKRYTTDDRLIDLVNEGNIGLIQAIDSFDVTKGTRFLTYAVWFIRREIVSFLINESNLIRKTNGSKTNFHTSKAKSDFFCQNGRYPTNDELIEIFEKEYGIKIQDSADLADIDIQSINTTFDGDDSNAFENSSEFTTKTCSTNEYMDEVESDYKNDVVSSLLGGLKERDRQVMEMAFGIGYTKEYTNAEIGESLNLTAERVRQIKNHALAKMQKMACQANI